MPGSAQEGGLLPDVHTEDKVHKRGCHSAGVGMTARVAEAGMEFDTNGIVQRSNIVLPAGFDWELEPRNIISERTAIYGISRSMFRGEWANLRSL